MESLFNIGDLVEINITSSLWEHSPELMSYYSGQLIVVGYGNGISPVVLRNNVSSLDNTGSHLTAYKKHFKLCILATCLGGE